MRIFSVPAAFLLAFFLFPILPRAAQWVDAAIAAAYRRLLPLFTRKNSQVDEAPALLFLLLLLAGVSALLGALHPAAAALLMVPLFGGLAVLPGCARIKDELDGKYARDIPTYEALVRKTCISLAPAFVSGVCVPLLLCAAGTPLHLGCALGWAYAALRVLRDKSRTARRTVVVLLRTGNAVLRFLFILCAGLAGRNPLRTQGQNAASRLMSILGIAGDGTDTHPPVSGDITQGIFICCFCTWLLCLMLTIVGFVFC